MACERKIPSKNPLRIYCRNCGAPAGFDIVRQMYRCTSCGLESGIAEAHEGVAQWRRLNKESFETQHTHDQVCLCTACGAQVIFARGQASQNCEFCGGTLVSASFQDQEHFPELILPFALTEVQAKKRLKEWLAEHPDTPEATMLKPAVNKVQGWYLPFHFVRGPINATVHRDRSCRSFTCNGYVEGSAISATASVSNLVLDAVEPFDYGALVPFEHGYMAGIRTKLNDVSNAEVEARVLEEAVRAYAPEVKRAMQTKGFSLEMSSGDLANIPVLLPFYIVRSGKLTAAVNGQTGAVAASTGRQERVCTKWWIEPTALTVVLFAIIAVLVGLNIATVLFTAIFGVVAFAGFSDGLKARECPVVVASPPKGSAGANNEDHGILANPLSNAPLFYEQVGGRKTAVALSFYDPARIVGFVVGIFALVLAPVIVAVAVRMVQGGLGFLAALSSLNLAYAGAWFFVTVGFAVALFAKGFRADAYDHPIAYALNSDGTKGKRVKLDKPVAVQNVRGPIDRELVAAAIGMFALFAGSAWALLFM